MRIALYVMAALVIGAFIKGIADMQAAVEAGMSPQSVLFGAAPMILIGLISLFCIAKCIGKSGETETNGAEASQPTDK